MALAQLFQVFVGEPNEGIMRAYGRVTTFSVRIEMLREVLSSNPYIDIDFKEENAKAISKIKTMSSLRNEIAHGYVTNPTLNGQNRGYFLFPSDISASSNSSARDYFSKLSKNDQADP